MKIRDIKRRHLRSMLRHHGYAWIMARTFRKFAPHMADCVTVRSPMFERLLKANPR